MKNIMSITISGHQIGPGAPAFIIAELSANHNQDLDLAKRLIHAAADAGADAVKLQTYTPDSLTLDCDNEHFRPRRVGLWKGIKAYDLFKSAMTPWPWHAQLQQVAAAAGLVLFSSPFDHEAVELLAGLDMPAWKIASFEITDIPLIEHAASFGRPVIISTGVATPEEIDEAVAACHRQDNRQVVLLKCTSAYPAPYDEMNLRAIPWLAERFGVPVGLSDHTPGWSMPVAAVALGARVIEKHITLDRNIPTADAGFSMEPAEFAAMVTAVRQVERALGDGGYIVTPQMEDSRKRARSLFVTADLKAGTEITKENVRSLRPAAGLHPRHLPEVIGCIAAVDIDRGTPLSWELLEED